mmetsp:Transcript_15184/g.36776  ORF Transcript_15184/g.36776 Transcript_15184/m.36776 type:complete len:207 (+) Transcript_15184:387-1007(+)
MASSSAQSSALGTKSQPGCLLLLLNLCLDSTSGGGSLRRCATPWVSRSSMYASATTLMSGSDSAGKSPVRRANRRTAATASASGSSTLSSNGSVASVCRACLSFTSVNTSGMVTASSAKRSRRNPLTMALVSMTALVTVAPPTLTAASSTGGGAAVFMAARKLMVAAGGRRQGACSAVSLVLWLQALHKLAICRRLFAFLLSFCFR